MCFSPPIRAHKENIVTHPVPGQSRKLVYVKMFSLSLILLTVRLFTYSHGLPLQRAPKQFPANGVWRIWGEKKPINRKHINIFLTALAGQSSQGRSPTRPRDKRDQMAILLWN